MPKYVAVPLLLRLYPGKKRQFCMYTGLQLNRIIGGFILDNNLEEELEELNLSSVIKEIKSRGSKLKNDKGIRKWHTHFIFGLDQEWRNGVQLGTEIGSGLSSAKKCDKKFVDCTWKITLGYNFAKLFE
jgi:superoxide dismutase